MTLASLLLFAFLLGMRHATDPDHLVAVTTILSRSQGARPAALVGALWGLGHSASILCVGTCIVLFKLAIPPHVGLGLEFAVAVMLIGLGALNLSPARMKIAHLAHAAPEHDSSKRLGIAGASRSLFIGVVHGLAGSAAVALLSVGTIHDARWAAAYLSIFALGTLAGMTLVTSFLAVPLAFGFRKFEGAHRMLAPAMGALSLGFGLLLAYRIGFVEGLFSLHPTWNPE